MELKEIVATRRKQLGLSQAELAKLAGIGTTTVADIERGRNKTTKKIYELAEALELTVDELRGRADSPKKALKEKIASSARHSKIDYESLTKALQEVQKVEKEMGENLSLDVKAQVVIACYAYGKKDLSTKNIIKILNSRGR